MFRQVLLMATLAAAPFAATTVSSQTPAPGPGSVCAAGEHHAAIRHSLVKPGQWGAFAEAVAAHNSWYVSHANKTTTNLVRVVKPGAGGFALSPAEAVTITRYADAPPPAHDAAYDAFTAQYKASSELKDEVRVCMP
ncbi:hypothetical protein HL653_20440 [Sphingomonas sp. AP4-R1]|uniref:hypothetical protein n=1 Tax=Sphingomonas sp. AP4-R1 TaxID=2735134 RepID=UPI001493C570|nr:hypothetical protein [Sphingomonas sp. AP4-R1]QJU59802.1 hypothetical protein HL653_20440 [Sphingomonas sp. AP4-R1]